MKNEIVVGLDDSPSGQAALDWAAEHARSVGAVLRAVHVLDWPYGLSSAGFPAPANFMELGREEIEDSYRRAITAVFEAVSPASDWTLQFASGDTGQVLVQQSKDARLLVVGTREHVGLGRLLTGSVSHHCLSHAVCPVVAVPAPAAGRRREDSEIVAPAAIARNRPRSCGCHRSHTGIGRGARGSRYDAGGGGRGCIRGVGGSSALRSLGGRATRRGPRLGARLQTSVGAGS